MKHPHTIRVLGAEISAELDAAIRDAQDQADHPLSGFNWRMKIGVADLVMAVLARHHGELIINDPDLPVEPLPRRSRGSVESGSAGAVETAMELPLEWLDRLDSDARIEGIGGDIRDGVPWIYANCTSADAAEQLVASLRDRGLQTVARRADDSVWLEPWQD